MDRNDFMFRRQFLLTQEICTSLNHWQHKMFDQFQIYVHPDLELNFIENKNTKLALIGYMIDPTHPERHNIEILDDMIEVITSVECVSKYLYSQSGRFVLVVSILGNTYIFHDPCGLRSVYYTEHESKIHIGSQPSIFCHIMPLIKGDRFFDYKYSDYYKHNSNHFIPSGCSLYESIQHLIPNHYLQVQNLKQVRYWPRQKLLKRELDDVVRESSDLLPRLMQAGNLRFNLALPLTAGWDSRVLLGACKKIADNIFFYTIQNRRLQSSSADIRIPQKILKKIGFSHHLLDCRKNADELFSQIYRSNVYNAHEYYETIAYGMLEKYPPNRVCVKGNCSEICRCYYYKSGKHPSISSVDQLIELERGWKTLDFVYDQLSDWYSRASAIITDTEIDVLDLFYWEHRMGSWQSQGQLEWDIFQEAYTPFNYRELLEAMLGVSPCYRRAPNYILYRKIATILWPEIMKYPVNPAINFVETIKNLLYRFGLAGIAKQIYKRFR